LSFLVDLVVAKVAVCRVSSRCTPAFDDFLSDRRSVPVQTFYTQRLAWTINFTNNASLKDNRMDSDSTQYKRKVLVTGSL